MDNSGNEADSARGGEDGRQGEQNAQGARDGQVEREYRIENTFGGYNTGPGGIRELHATLDSRALKDTGHMLDNPLLAFGIITQLGYHSKSTDYSQRVLGEYVEILKNRGTAWNDILDILAARSGSGPVVSALCSQRLRATLERMEWSDITVHLANTSNIFWEALASGRHIDSMIEYVSERGFGGNAPGGVARVDVWWECLKNRCLSSQGRMVAIKEIGKACVDGPRLGHILACYTESFIWTPMTAEEKAELLHGLVPPMAGGAMGILRAAARSEGLSQEDVMEMLDTAINVCDWRTCSTGPLILELLARDDMDQAKRSAVIGGQLKRHMYNLKTVLKEIIGRSTKGAQELSEEIWKAPLVGGGAYVGGASSIVEFVDATRGLIGENLAKYALGATGSINVRRAVATKGGWHADVFDALIDSKDLATLSGLLERAPDEQRFNAALARLAGLGVAGVSRAIGIITREGPGYTIYSTTLAKMMSKGGGLGLDDKRRLMDYMARVNTAHGVGRAIAEVDAAPDQSAHNSPSV